MKSSLWARRAVNVLAAAHATLSPEEFAETYRKTVLSVQGCFGDPGFGPVASLNTERADQNRAALIRRLHTIHEQERVKEVA